MMNVGCKTGVSSTPDTIGLPMFGLRKTADSAKEWDLDQGLEPEEEFQVPESVGVLKSMDPSANHYDPSGEQDYYEGIVKASISHGGKYGVHEIPVSWLRVILAGLEGKDVGIDPMLVDPRTDGPALDSIMAQGAAGPSYTSVFPAE